MSHNSIESRTVVVRVLGSSEIRVAGRTIGLGTELLFALALYIATRAGDRIARQHILDTFWPTGEEELRRHAMRQMMYRLRQTGIVLEETGEHVYLDPTSVDSDLLDCLQKDWPTSASPAAIQRTIGLGPLFSAKLAAPFLEWFDGIRAEVERQLRCAAQLQVVSARKEGRWEDLDRWAQVILRSDSLNEEATLARAESAAMSGSKLKAVEILDNFIAEVSCLDPSVCKPAEILRKRISERRADWGRRRPTDVALVGREPVMARLNSALEDTGLWRGGGISISGAPGIGKTRLVTEATTLGSLRGVRPVAVWADSTLRAQPLGAVRALATTLFDQPGALATAPAQLALLKDLASHSNTRHPAHSEQLKIPAIAEALENLLRAISASTRLAIHIDDGHNVDRDSRAVFEHAIGACENLRVLWIVTSRSLQNAWVPGPSRIVLAPLTSEEATELARRVCIALDRKQSEDGVAAIARRAGGNPMFVIEVASHRPGATPTAAIPATLQDSVRVRLSSLDERQVKLLRIVSLLGHAATLERCIEVLQLGASETSDLATALEAEGILFLSEQRTLSLHECWQQEVLNSLSRVAEAAICLQCADAIAGFSLSSLDYEDLWRAASLYARAGATARALDGLLLAADQLLAKGLLSEASSVMNDARALPRFSRRRLNVLSREAELLLARGDLQEVLQLTDSLPQNAEEAVRAGESATEWVLAVAQRMDALGKTTLGRRIDDSRLKLAAQCHLAEPFARHYAAFIGARQAVWNEDRSALTEYYNIGMSDARTCGRSLACGFLELVYTAEAGTADEYLEAYARQIEHERSSYPFRLVQQSRRFRGGGLRMHGFIREAAQVAVESYEISREQHQPELAASCAELLAFLHLDQDNANEGLEWARIGASLGAASDNAIRTKGLRHAELRSRLQLGDAVAVAEHMRGEIGGLLLDQLRTRRSGELLTYCLAHLQSGGDGIEIMPYLNCARQDIDESRAQFLSDYPFEMLIRVMSALGHKDLEVTRRKLVARRREQHPRPLTPFYRELNAGSDFPVARIDKTLN